MAKNIEAKAITTSGYRTFFVMFGMLVMPLLIYSMRAVQTKTVTYPFYIEAAYLSVTGISTILLCIVIAAVYAVSQSYGLLKQRHPQLLFLLIATGCAIVIAIFAPVLPTTEQAFFDQHKAEFYRQVEFIKQGNSLNQYDNLAINTEAGADVITFSYSFKTHPSAYAYVYAERDIDLEHVITCTAGSQGTGGAGKIYATLDTHWYLCYRVGD